ncbi:VOC family protein [Kribbella sp. NPDC055071]
MTSQPQTLSFGAHDPERLARFWSGVFGWETRDGVVLVPNDDTGFELRFVANHEPKTRPNQMHFDLTSSSLEDQQKTVARVLELGGRHLDIGQGPDADHVVLADPEGNEFCVIEPWNNFLSECGFFGCLVGDGSQQVGYFWSEALGWPLVWDQDEETAVRSTQGGPIISWGGPPVGPKVGPNRLYFDLTPVDGDVQAEVDRLVSLGATRTSEDSAGRVAMTDPDGNEFCLVPARG